jgi:hypothetical protein
MDPAIKPGSTPNGPLPVLGHTKNAMGQYSSYVTPEMIKQQEKRQKESDLKWYELNDKKNK